ncbi:MAG: DoxX family protein [Deltaproteobacteria bacterium]|nr:DoxX family protein [Deltaproteobacteria bacterium]
MNTMISLRQRIANLSASLEWLPPLLLRVVLGVTFALTGWGKLHNLEQVTQFFDSLGIPAASVQAPFVAGVEFVGGILILVGLGTRVAAALLVAVMAVAIATAIWPKSSFTELLGSIEAVYLAAFAYLAVKGAGAVSLDHVVSRFGSADRAQVHAA